MIEVEVGPLSASTLAYLFGHELAGEVSHHRIHQVQFGVEVPTTGTIVVSSELDVQMLTLAVWEACEVGALRVDLDAPTGIRGVVAGRAVVLSPTGAPVEMPGLGGRLVHKVRPGSTIFETLVRLWPRYRVYLPLNALVLDAQHEAVDVGALVATDAPGPRSHALGWSAGAPRYEVAAGGLGLVEQLWDDVNQRWLAARQADPQRWHAVSAQARHALTDRRPEVRVMGSPMPPPPI